MTRRRKSNGACKAATSHCCMPRRAPQDTPLPGPARRPACPGQAVAVRHRRGALRDRWGHDFPARVPRADVLHERYAGVPRCITATADALTRADIVERLQLESARHFVSSFDRPNIRYRIAEKKDVSSQLLRFIEREHERGRRGLLPVAQARGGWPRR
ncbi:Bloom syndrome protein [Manis javanica]|nr:Bloom syndrome protein [Manis javanica]